MFRPINPQPSVKRAATIAVAAVLVGIPTSQADAASSMNASLTVTTTTDGSPSNVWHHAHVNVNLPMSAWDAQGYINNGARVEVMCYGDDTFHDEKLLNRTRVYTGTSSGSTGANLYANSSGVHLNAVIDAKHGGQPPMPTTPNEEGFDEDWGVDEVYCKATWVDGDGAKLAAFTNVVSGNF